MMRRAERREPMMTATMEASAPKGPPVMISGPEISGMNRLSLALPPETANPRMLPWVSSLVAQW